MKLTRPSEVRALLETRGVQPRKSLGQNFLVDENILRILVEAVELTAQDRILEIGPGLGVLTHQLAQRAGFIFAVEKDDRLFEGLAGEFPEGGPVLLLHADALDVSLDTVRGHRCNKLVSNLPYGSGNRILMEYFLAGYVFDRIVVTVQDDVAHRLVADPDTSAYSLLSIWAQLDYRVSIRKIINATCFYPPPRVQSAIVVFEPRGEDRFAIDDRRHLESLLKIMFTQRRKQLGTLLRKAPPEITGQGSRWRSVLETLGFQPEQRPETVGIPEWVALSNALSEKTCRGNPLESQKGTE